MLRDEHPLSLFPDGLERRVVRQRHLEDSYPQACAEFLQTNFSAVAEADRIAMPVRCGAQLHKRHFFNGTNRQIVLQTFWNIEQNKPGTWRHAHSGVLFGRPPRYRCARRGQTYRTSRKPVNYQLLTLDCKPVWNSSQRVITHFLYPSLLENLLFRSAADARERL